jgi:CMP/dCMP kinase
VEWMIITIDGPVATGKSTLAKRLALSIGYIYYDTGAMYRAVTYGILQNHIDMDNPEQLQDYLQNKFDFDIRMKRGERRYFLGKEDVTDKIRLQHVTSEVSRISANPKVREKLMEIQREMSKGVNAIFEGRDMGSVVFPDALKFYLTGRPEVRAKRRFDELKAKYPEDSKDLTLEIVLKDIEARDAYDSKRDVSPLVKAQDAFEIDTSDLTEDEIIYKILELKDTRKTKIPGK